MNQSPSKLSVSTRSLIQKGASYALGDGSTTVANLVIFTLLLRYLAPAEFGYLSVGQALSSWVQPVLYMGASFVAVRLIAANPSQTQVIARRMITLRLAAAVVVASGTGIAALHSSEPSLRAVLLAYSGLFLLYPVQPDFIAIGLHRPRVYSVARWIGSACFLAGVIMLTRISLRAWMVPLAYAASLFASAAYGYFALWPALRAHKEQTDSGFGVLFRGAILVIAAQFLQMGQAAINVLSLSIWKIPARLIGDYSAVARLTQAGAVPLIALIYSLAPVYVKQFATRDIASIKKLEWRFRICLLLVGLVGATVIVSIGPQILELVSGRRMPSAYQLAPIFALGYFLVAVHNSYTAVLVYAGANHLYVAVYALGFLGTLLAAIVLIPRFGTIGSGWSEVAGLAIILTASCLFHRRLLRQQQQESDACLQAIEAS